MSHQEDWPEPVKRLFLRVLLALAALVLLGVGFAVVRLVAR